MVVPEPGVVAPPEVPVVVQLLQARHPLGLRARLRARAGDGEARQRELLHPELVLPQAAVEAGEGLGEALLAG